MKRFYFIAAAILSFFLFSKKLSSQPVAVCKSDVEHVYLNPVTCQTVTWASYFDAASYSPNSTITDMRINLVSDSDYSGQLEPDELLTEPPTTDTVVFHAYLPPTTYVQFWVIDDNGDFDDCLTEIDIVPTCIDPVVFFGNVSTINGEGLEGVEIEFETYTSVFTKPDGDYLLRLGLIHDDVIIIPHSKDSLTEGIDENDLRVITRHILHIERIESPYKLIAADVNNDGRISMIDLFILRKAMLGLITEFPNNKTWRFVPEDYVFSGTELPTVSGFPEKALSYNSFSSVNEYNFIGIKIGDLTD